MLKVSIRWGGDEEELYANELRLCGPLRRPMGESEFGEGSHSLTILADE